MKRLLTINLLIIVTAIPAGAVIAWLLFVTHVIQPQVGESALTRIAISAFSPITSPVVRADAPQFMICVGPPLMYCVVMFLAIARGWRKTSHTMAVLIAASWLAIMLLDTYARALP